MPTPLEDWINNTLAGLPSSTLPAGGLDPNQILKDRPDVLAEYNDEAGRDLKSQTNLQSLGIFSPQDYATWWANKYGYHPPGGSDHAIELPPTTPTTTTTTPSLPTSGPGSTDYLNAARLRALTAAHLASQARGLDPTAYDSDFNSYLDSLFAGIPAGDQNPQSYIDPNFADQILNGKQFAARNSYTNAASKYAHSGLDYHSLDPIINKILDDASNSGENMIQAGLKRGQFNDIGVQAGEKALSTAKAKARAKLDTAANDIFNTYDSKFNDLYNRAYAAASGYQLGQNFDTSGYDQEYQRLQDSAKADAEGNLYNVIGDTPLINLTDIRGAIGQGQGAVNLTDLDVLDALSKRKQASNVGRGLGSEGAF